MQQKNQSIENTELDSLPDEMKLKIIQECDLVAKFTLRRVSMFFNIEATNSLKKDMQSKNNLENLAKIILSNALKNPIEVTWSSKMIHSS